MRTFDDLQFSDVTFLTESSDYKDRFLGEYLTTKMRYEKLHRKIIEAEAGTLNFTPRCPLDLLKSQARCMVNYLYTLELRAQYEDVDLPFAIKSLLTDLEREESGSSVADHPTY